MDDDDLGYAEALRRHPDPAGVVGRFGGNPQEELAALRRDAARYRALEHLHRSDPYGFGALQHNYEPLAVIADRLGGERLGRGTWRHPVSEEMERGLDMWEWVREARAATSDAMAEATRLRQLVADLTPLARIGLEALDGWIQCARNYGHEIPSVEGFDAEATQRARAFLTEQEVRDE